MEKRRAHYRLGEVVSFTIYLSLACLRRRCGTLKKRTNERTKVLLGIEKQDVCCGRREAIRPSKVSPSSFFFVPSVAASIVHHRRCIMHGREALWHRQLLKVGHAPLAGGKCTAVYILRSGLVSPHGSASSVRSVGRSESKR